MCSITIKVFQSSAAFAQNKRALERIIESVESSSIPFDSIIQALRFLYGESAIVQLNISSL